MVVSSLPAYVVGTATIGSPWLRASALASPVDEPPPMHDDGVGAGLGRRRPGPLGELDGHVLGDLVPAPASRGSELLGDGVAERPSPAPSVISNTRSAPEPLDLRGHLGDAAGAEHDAAGQRTRR